MFISDDFIGYLETFFLLIHKIVPLSGREKLYISNQRYGNLSSCKVPDLSAVFVGLLSSRIGKFLKNKKIILLLDIAFLLPVRGVTNTSM